MCVILRHWTFQKQYCHRVILRREVARGTGLKVWQDGLIYVQDASRVCTNWRCLVAESQWARMRLAGHSHTQGGRSRSIMWQVPLFLSALISQLICTPSSCRLDSSKIIIRATYVPSLAQIQCVWEENKPQEKKWSDWVWMTVLVNNTAWTTTPIPAVPDRISLVQLFNLVRIFSIPAGTVLHSAVLLR